MIYFSLQVNVPYKESQQVVSTSVKDIRKNSSSRQFIPATQLYTLVGILTFISVIIMVTGIFSYFSHGLCCFDLKDQQYIQCTVCHDS
jgi:hypothetical protein